MEHAVVRVYDTRSYKVFGEPLPGHILTVTRISFSPDDKLILTVSRDRTWRLFEAQNEDGKYSIFHLLLTTMFKTPRLYSNCFRKGSFPHYLGLWMGN